METFLSGGTGTPKLLAGVPDRSEVTVVGNTGDDAEIGGHLVCPDLDTVLYLEASCLDRDRWWGIEDDTTTTHDSLQEIAETAGLDSEAVRLPDDKQTDGRDIARWRRLSGVGELMLIGDRDRAVHITRTSLLDRGHTLTEAMEMLARSADARLTLLPMSDDPVATYLHTPDGELHFQEFWIAHNKEPTVVDIEYRGIDRAKPTEAVMAALEDPVIVGPSNPITSIGPIIALDGVADALHQTPVVAVSPFVGNDVFSGPAKKLMRAEGYEPNTAGVADAYPFADAFVLDSSDPTELDRPVVRTDIEMTDEASAARVYEACQRALEKG